MKWKESNQLIFLFLFFFFFLEFSLYLLVIHYILSVGKDIALLKIHLCH